MGGGEGDDPQKLKRIAAAAYDYENDARWADYWSNVLLPPHMSSRSDVVDHFKCKFYQRYIDPDLLVEPMATSTTPARPPAPSPQSTSSSASGSIPRQRSSGSASRTSGTPATPPPDSASLRWDSQTIQFSVNAWVFLVGVLSVFPLMPKNLSNRAYRLSFLGTACSSLYSLYSLYGKPRAWNLQALQVWFQSVLATKDFLYAIYCLNFVTSHVCLKFALIPILCRTLEHVTKFLRRNFNHSTLYRRYLEKACVWVESNTTTLGVLSSQAEIGIGFLLIISLLVAAEYHTGIHVLAAFEAYVSFSCHCWFPSKYMVQDWAFRESINAAVRSIFKHSDECHSEMVVSVLTSVGGRKGGETRDESWHTNSVRPFEA